MKRLFVIAISGIGLWLGSGCAALDPNPDAVIARSFDSASTDPSKLDGQALYANFCTTCHNLDGSPVDTLSVRDLRNYGGTYATFDSTLNSGPGAMPIFSIAQLDSGARRRLFDFVLTLH